MKNTKSASGTGVSRSSTTFHYSKYEAVTLTPCYTQLANETSIPVRERSYQKLRFSVLASLSGWDFTRTKVEIAISHKYGRQTLTKLRAELSNKGFTTNLKAKSFGGITGRFLQVNKA